MPGPTCPSPFLAVYCQHEIGIYLKGNGVPEDKVVTFNIGGTIEIGGGCKVTMVRRALACPS